MPGNRITDTSVLLRQECWALLRYADGSEFCFRTTLNSDILRQKGVLLEEGKLVRLDKQYFLDGRMTYKQIPTQGASVTLWDALTYTDRDSLRLHDFL